MKPIFAARLLFPSARILQLSSFWSLSPLQLVQNAAAQLLTGISRRHHITPILAHLIWLSVRFRIDL